jgi:hypothetical protein
MFEVSSNKVLIVAISTIFLSVVQAIQSLFFHDLSKYPGPRLAAMTSLYRAYFDIVRDGGWVQHLFSLHEKYGEHTNKLDISRHRLTPAIQERLLELDPTR